MLDAVSLEYRPNVLAKLLVIGLSASTQKSDIVRASLRVLVVRVFQRAQIPFDQLAFLHFLLHLTFEASLQLFHFVLRSHQPVVLQFEIFVLRKEGNVAKLVFLSPKHTKLDRATQ